MIYAAEAIRFRANHGSSGSLRRLAADYPKWRDSQRRGAQPLADGLPWLTFGAIQFLQSRLTARMHVFEYGSGGSTIFFARHVAEVFSVEHDRTWSQTVTQTLASLGIGNATVLFVEPSADSGARARDPADPDAYVSSDLDMAGKTFREYAASIDPHADGEFQVILIDGRARPSCFKHALPKVAPGGLIVLDNAERAVYKYIPTTLKRLGWQQHDFAGPGPTNRIFWKTTAWSRPDN